MSPLTKLFVVLQVILSIALTAGIVVYVSREDVQLQQKNALANQLAQAQSERDAASASASAARENANAIQLQSAQQVDQMSRQLTAAQQQIADLNVQLAQARANGATQELQITRLTEGLNASQRTTEALNQSVAQLRTSSDQAVRQTAEMGQRISELTAMYDTTERQRRQLAEELAEIQQRQGAVSDSNRQGSQTPQAPPINGVVRNRRNIAGVEYATISVGSADDVAKGMQFRVIDRDSGQFLGMLTVEAVEPNEASGRLSGPRVADIRPGVEVRTQY